MENWKVVEFGMMISRPGKVVEFFIVLYKSGVLKKKKIVRNFYAEFVCWLVA